MLSNLILSAFLAASILLANNGFAGNDEQKDEVIWVDVRSEAEHQADHSAGDSRIDFTEIVTGITSLYPDKATAINLYCAAGGRAGKAADALRAAGYTQVTNAGGIKQVRVERDL